MCGIAGVLDSSGAPRGELGHLAAAMAATLVHRGPDATGLWEDDIGGVALAHRRLEVVGRGTQGSQPMRGGNWVLNYNGELYNAAVLRAALADAGAAPTGSSDTEALLLALCTWGLDEALRRAEGMFAFSAWDGRSRTLHLVRDRFGEKPLFYGWAGGRFVFASELKAFHALSGFRPAIDPRSVARMLQLSCVPAPACIYEGFAKLSPGTVVSVTENDRPGVLPLQRRYWSAADAIEESRRLPVLSDDVEAEATIHSVLSASVAARMTADVPVGALLSGGIDSSLIVALMQQHTSYPVRTFTVAFSEESFDESASAAAVASHLGTEHTTVEMPPREVLSLVPRLPEIWDEPFSDSSQLPTHLVATVARRSVTVALSGDGGDELFAGYNRHAWLERIWRRSAPIPAGTRRLLGDALRRVPPGTVDGAVARLPRRWQLRLPGTKLHKLGRVLAAPTIDEAYRALLVHWERPEDLVKGLNGSGWTIEGAQASPGRTSPLNWDLPAAEGGITERMLQSDLVSYLPDDILTKVDRASMAVSLESRAPFLDRDVLEAAWRLPESSKVRDGTSKWVLRQVLDRYVPRDLVERPKMGFGVPLAGWLRGPLRGWAEDLLSPAALSRDGLLEPVPIRHAWRLHSEGRRDLSYELWDVLMLQSWLDRWR